MLKRYEVGMGRAGLAASNRGLISSLLGPAFRHWGALWAPYFFKNESGHNVTVNEERYRAMINDFFVSESEDVDVDDLWFQQDGATYHTAKETINLLKETFCGVM